MQYLLMTVLLGVFLYGTIFNGVVFVSGYFLKRKAPSVVPFIGGMAGAYLMRLLPWEGFHRYYWVPLFLDFGCVLYGVSICIYLLMEQIRPTPKDPM